MILYPEVLILIPLILFVTNKKNFFFSLSAIFLVLALSGISKKEIKKVKIPSSDIFLVIDSTYSMACDDLKPNRLEFAKKEIKELLKYLKKPIGVVSFDKRVHLLTFPTTDYQLILKKIKPLKPVISKTDILMAINFVKYLSNNKKIIVVVSDGGEKKIKGDFIFWGFATKKGAKVPKFDAISRLNIIGKKYFKYNETKKLAKYLNSTTLYSTKEVVTYKSYSYFFVIFSFIFFTIGIIFSKFRFFAIFLILFPYNAKANDFLGCFYEYIGLKNLAIKEFKKSDTPLSHKKLALFYIQKNKYYDALKEIQKAKNTPQNRYIKALILTKLQKYKDAFNTLKNIPLDKNGIKLYNLLKKYAKIKSDTIVYETNSTNAKIIQKEHLW
ncbi:VWA domain-containing protein [Caminibacter sp.]